METDAGLSRGIKAVLFSDMKGYSSKMSQDEARAFRLIEEHDRLVTPIVTHHHGRLIKKIGDAIMAAFAAASDAVNCAIDIQEVLANHNHGKEPVDQIIIRIGIHVGEVMEKDGDLFGHGVNIAARIEPHAKPGGIAVSQSIVSMLQAQPQFHFLRGGDHQVKNLEEALSIFHVERGAADLKQSPGHEAPAQDLRPWPWRWGLGVVAAGLFALGVFALPARAPDSTPAASSPGLAEEPTESPAIAETSPREKLLVALAKRDKSFRVGLAPLDPIGCEAALAQSITEHLGATLRGAPNVSIEQLSAPVPQGSDEAIGAWAVERGEALHLDYMVVGSVGYLGSKTVMSLRRFSTQSGQVDLRSYRLVDSTDALLGETDAAWLELSSELQDGLETSAIDTVIQDGGPELKRCYEEGGAGKSGKVAISFEIATSGRVRAVDFHKDEIGEPAFEECVVEEARQWLFPPFRDGVQRVRYPFWFSPAK